MSATISIRRPDDFHVHLRSGDMLNRVAHHTEHWGRVLAMPNLSPNPVLTGSDAIRYAEEVQAQFQKWGSTCEPLMTIQLTEDTTPEMIRQAKAAGVVAAKVYPRGQTTNSDNGVLNYMALYPAISEMENCDMVLSLHPEVPNHDISVLDRESKFIEFLEALLYSYSSLRVVVEHVTTKAMVDFVKDARFAATITAHHLLLTLDDVIGDKLQPHNFCKPIAKFKSDRTALIEAATSGNPKFFFGSDSAPHLRGNKECSHGCAGVYTAPIILPVLAEVFEATGKLGKLEDFTSKFGAEFYGLELNQGIISLEKTPWRVPDEYNGIVPFRFNQELQWQVV